MLLLDYYKITVKYIAPCVYSKYTYHIFSSVTAMTMMSLEEMKEAGMVGTEASRCCRHREI